MFPVLLKKFKLDYFECFKACKYNNDIYISDYRSNEIRRYTNCGVRGETFDYPFSATLTLIAGDYLYYVPQETFGFQRNALTQIKVYDLKNKLHHTVIKTTEKINQIFSYNGKLYVTYANRMAIYATTTNTHEMDFAKINNKHITHVNADETNLYISTLKKLYVYDLQLENQTPKNEFEIVSSEIQETLITSHYIYIIKVFGDVIQIDKKTMKIVGEIDNGSNSIYYAFTYNDFIGWVHDNNEMRFYDEKLNCIYKSNDPIFGIVEYVQIFDDHIYIFNADGEVFVYENYYQHHRKSLPQTQQLKISNLHQLPIQKDLKYLFEKELLQEPF